MANQTVTLQRDDGQQPHQEQQESFGSIKRCHIVFILFKLLAIIHFNSQPIEALSHTVLRIYIVYEVIYLVALIQVTGSAIPHPIHRYLYIVSGILDAELLIWTSLSLAMWLVVNICLLVFVLASCGVLSRVSGWLEESVQPSDDVPIFEVQFDS